MDASRRIAAPAEVVWALLTDTARWPDWGPSVTVVDPHGATVRPGLRGRVRTAVGIWLPFEVTHVEDRGPTRRWDWRVAGIPATGHRVEDLGDGTCLAALEVPAMAAPYLAVCHLALRRLARIASPPTGAPSGALVDATGGMPCRRG